MDRGSPMTLRSDVERYIAFKRGQGHKMLTEENLLCRYVSYAEANGNIFAVASRMVEWAGTARSPSSVRNRLNALRCFARWVHAEDQRHEVPPNNVGPGQKVRPAPHLLSPADIRRLIDAALSLGPAGSITPHMYHFMFGLMAVTGLRRSEALALRLEDVTPDGLLVRETKFRKSRLVPLHDSTWRALERYLELRARTGSGDDHLFVLSSGKPPTPNGVTRTFVGLALRLGLRHRGRGCGVRLHDLRHSFASRALALGESLPTIGKLLGHSKIQTTARYAHLARDSVQESAARVAASIGADILPEGSARGIDSTAPL